MCPPGPARRPSAVGTEGRGWEWGGGGCSSGRGGHVAVQWPYPEPVVLLAVQRGIEEHFAAEFVDGEDAQGLLIHPRPLDAVDHPPWLLLVRLYLCVGGSRVGAGGCRPVPSPPSPHPMPWGSLQPPPALPTCTRRWGMRLWFSEMLMGGITQALFTRRDPSWCCQPGGLPRAALASCRGGMLGRKELCVCMGQEHRAGGVGRHGGYGGVRKRSRGYRGATGRSQ